MENVAHGARGGEISRLATLELRTVDAQRSLNEILKAKPEWAESLRIMRMIENLARQKIAWRERRERLQGRP